MSPLQLQSISQILRDIVTEIDEDSLLKLEALSRKDLDTVTHILLGEMVDEVGEPQFNPFKEVAIRNSGGEPGGGPYPVCDFPVCRSRI